MAVPAPVRNSTLAASAVPVRVTVIRALAFPDVGSFTVYAAALSWTAPPWSSSTIVTTAWLGDPSVAPPWTLLRLTRKVSFPSNTESATIGTGKVFIVSPGAKVSVPARGS